MAEWKTPKTDWVTNPKNPVAEDFNRIEGNIQFLKDEIEAKKGAIVNALNTVGLETELTDTHEQIANKIINANQGTKIITPGTSNITIPKGFHSGEGYVIGDPNLKPENIAINKTIFGITGTYLGKFIKSIQQGCNLLKTSSNPQNITINPINLDSSILLVYTPSFEEDKFYALMHGATLDTTSITVSVRMPTSSRNCNIQWVVIEFEPSIIKSKQTGSLTLDSSNSLQDVTITPVNISKSFIITSGFMAYSFGTTDGNNNMLIAAMPAYFVNNSTIRFRSVHGGRSISPVTITWQVIEFV